MGDVLPQKLRGRPAGGGLGAARALGAVGRAALASAAGGHEAQHRAYLQLLQERNQAYRQLREEQESREGEKLRREQGFSVCFSGANAREKKTPTGAGARHRDANGLLRLGDAQHSGGPGGVWRTWEEKTVEIRGKDGEVYAVRPTGERREPSRAQDQDPRTLRVPQEVDEALRATLSATQQDLKSLCRQLALQGLVEEGHASEAEADGEGDGEGEVDGDGGAEEEAGDAGAAGSFGVEMPPEGEEASFEALTLAFSRSRLEASGSLPRPEASGALLSPISAFAMGSLDASGAADLPASPGRSPSSASASAGGAAAPASPAAASPASPAAAPPASLAAPEHPVADTPEPQLALPSPTAAELAHRIAKLPRGWRGALIRLLEEAEADAAQSAPASPATPQEHCGEAPPDGGDPGG